MNSINETADQVLRRVFGYDSFRTQQGEIVEHLISGGDALVLMPTGGGKSLCYQIPALVRNGTAIVISPLIALMQDQVSALKELGVSASFLNSHSSAAEVRGTWAGLAKGELDLLYVAPEKLLSPGFLDELAAATTIALFAIDEAHCVSQWGHDFRPDYRQLNVIHERFPDIPRVALTATADEPTRREIITHLGLGNARVFISGFDRPNITYRVTPKKEVRKQLLGLLREHEGDSGIVYCLSRRKVEQTAEWLVGQGYRALPYHAGMRAEDRQRNQEIFIREEGIIVVATIAFGMGIDKPNVRFVAHLDLPKSIEAYYQETGRAGRDGLPATAWLAYGLGDLIMLRQMIETSEADEARKRVERNKLLSLTAFADSADCRRRILLRHFGEVPPDNCANCDNCIQPPKVWDGTIAAQKALSCVYRTGQKFGAVHLADVLVGSESEKVLRFRHQNLSVYGIGKELPAEIWTSVFRQLAASGYLDTDVEGFGSFRLTGRAEEVFQGRVKVFFRDDIHLSFKAKSRHAEPPSSRLTLDDEATNLLNRLKQKRLSIARAQKLPPYVIFHDKTLVEIATRKPSTLAEFSTISGVGEHKLAHYGATFIRVILGGAAEGPEIEGIDAGS